MTTPSVTKQITAVAAEVASIQESVHSDRQQLQLIRDAIVTAGISITPSPKQIGDEICDATWEYEDNSWTAEFVYRCVCGQLDRTRIEGVRTNTKDGTEYHLKGSCGQESKVRLWKNKAINEGRTPSVHHKIQEGLTSGLIAPESPI